MSDVIKLDNSEQNPDNAAVSPTEADGVQVELSDVYGDVKETLDNSERLQEKSYDSFDELSTQQAVAAVEAVLFALGKAVEIGTLSKALDITESRLLKLLKLMDDNYKDEARGIYINYLENKVQLCTKKEYYDILIKIAAQPKKPVLSGTVLETLSIVAYKQPVTKGEIERIRGVKSDFAVNKLVEYGLIEEVGRLDAPGRPVLFATTEEFLRRFGISSTEGLPQIAPDKLEEFEQEARDEITV